MIIQIILLSYLGNILNNVCDASPLLAGETNVNANPFLNDTEAGSKFGSGKENITAGETDNGGTGTELLDGNNGNKTADNGENGKSGGLADGGITGNSTEEVFMRDNKRVHGQMIVHQHHHNGTHGNGESENGDRASGERGSSSDGAEGLGSTGVKRISPETGKELPLLRDSLTITTALPTSGPDVLLTTEPTTIGSSSVHVATPSPTTADDDETEEKNASEEEDGDSGPNIGEGVAKNGSYDTYKDEYFIRGGKRIHRHIIIHHHHHRETHHDGSHEDDKGPHHHHHYNGTSDDESDLQRHHHNGTHGGLQRHHHKGRHGESRRRSPYDDDDDEATDESPDDGTMHLGRGTVESHGNSSETADKSAESSHKDANPILQTTPSPNIKSNNGTDKANKAIGEAIQDEVPKTKDTDAASKNSSASKNLPLLKDSLSLTTALPTSSPDVRSTKGSNKADNLGLKTTPTPNATPKSAASDGNANVRTDKGGKFEDKDKAASDQANTNASGNSEGDKGSSGQKNGEAGGTEADKHKVSSGKEDANASHDLDGTDKDDGGQKKGGKDIGSAVSSRESKVQDDSSEVGDTTKANPGDGLLNMDGIGSDSSDNTDVANFDKDDCGPGMDGSWRCIIPDSGGIFNGSEQPVGFLNGGGQSDETQNGGGQPGETQNGDGHPGGFHNGDYTRGFPNGGQSGGQPDGFLNGGGQPGETQNGDGQQGGFQNDGEQQGEIQNGGKQPDQFQHASRHPGGFLNGGEIQNGAGQTNGFPYGGGQTVGFQNGGQPGANENRAVSWSLEEVPTGGGQPEEFPNGGLQPEGFTNGEKPGAILQNGSGQPQGFQNGGGQPGAIQNGGRQPETFQRGGVQPVRILKDAQSGGTQNGGTKECDCSCCKLNGQ